MLFKDCGRTDIRTTTDGEWSQKLTLSFQLRWAKNIARHVLYLHCFIPYLSNQFNVIKALSLSLSLNSIKYIKTQCIFKYQLIKLNNLKNQPYICHAIRKRVLRHMWTAKAQMADCVDAQPDQGLHCLLTDSLDTAKCMNRDKGPETAYRAIGRCPSGHTTWMRRF